MTQTEHVESGAGTSQCDLILAALLTTPRGEWVSMPHLAHIGAGSADGFCMVHSRVADLRRRGYVIEQLSRRVLNTAGVAKVHSFYRLLAS